MWCRENKVLRTDWKELDWNSVYWKNMQFWASYYWFYSPACQSIESKLIINGNRRRNFLSITKPNSLWITASTGNDISLALAIGCHVCSERLFPWLWREENCSTFCHVVRVRNELQRSSLSASSPWSQVVCRWVNGRLSASLPKVVGGNEEARVSKTFPGCVHSPLA